MGTKAADKINIATSQTDWSVEYHLRPHEAHTRMHSKELLLDSRIFILTVEDGGTSMKSSGVGIGAFGNSRPIDTVRAPC